MTYRSQLITSDSSEQILHRDHTVKAARTKPLEIERDKLEAQSRKVQISSPRSSSSMKRGKSSSETSMRARSPLWYRTSQDPQTATAKPVFGLVNHPVALGAYLFPVGNPTRQARRCRFVPGRQTPGLSQRTDVSLAHPTFLKGVADPVLRGSTQAGAIVTHVVNVRPGNNHIGSQLSQHPLQPPIQLALAKVAAISIVTHIIRIGKLLGADDPVGNADSLASS